MVVALLLAACGGVMLKSGMSPNGVPYTAIIDALDNPCKNRGVAHGCHARFNGQHYIYHTSVAPKYVVEHEIAHVDGMEHSDWEYDSQQKANCSFITKQLLPKYPLGYRLCVTYQKEWTYKLLETAK